jgi:hypothetical protein
MKVDDDSNEGDIKQSQNDSDDNTPVSSQSNTEMDSKNS